MTTRKNTAKGKAKTPAKSVQAAKPTEGYRGHKVGSRKATIHELFDREGDDTAWTRGLKIGLKEATLRTWFAHWRRQTKPAPAKKKGAKTNSVTAPTTKPEAVAAA